MKFECTFWDPESQLDIGKSEFFEADNGIEATKKMITNQGDVSGFIKVWSDETGYIFYKFHSRDEGRILNLNRVEHDGRTINSTNHDNSRASNRRKNLIPDVSAWAMIHYVVGSICLIGFVISLSGSSDGDSHLMITLAIACFIFGTILQSLKTICFYLRVIYERMN